MCARRFVGAMWTLRVFPVSSDLFGQRFRKYGSTNGKVVVLVLWLFDAWKKGKHIIPKVMVMNPIAKSVKNHPSKWFGGPNCFGMFFRGTPKYQSLREPSCIHPTLKAEPSVGSGVSKHFLGGFKNTGGTFPNRHQIYIHRYVMTLYIASCSKMFEAILVNP